MQIGTFWKEIGEEYGYTGKELMATNFDNKRIEVIGKEYDKIKDKESNLSANARTLVIEFHNRYEAIKVANTMASKGDII